MQWLLIQHRNCLLRRNHHELYFASLGFTHNIRVYGEPAVNPRPDHQTVTTPGDLLACRKRRMPELAAERLRRTFSALSYLPAVYDDVVVIFDPVDPDRSEGEVIKYHFERMVHLSGTSVTGASWHEHGRALLEPA
jgi:hypothetical protein